MAGDLRLGTAEGMAIVREHLPSASTAMRWGILVNLEIASVLLYVNLTPNTITNPLIAAYPFVWINIAIWALLRVERPRVSTRRRRIGIGLGIAYFALLLVVGGMLRPGHLLHGHDHGSTAVRIALGTLPPGWGPMIVYGGALVSLTLIPFKLIGYAVLSVLVVYALVEIDGSALTGSLGLISCVSCTWPVLGTVVTTLFGGGSVVATLATNEPYGLSTLVFVSAVLLLVWRPFADRPIGSLR